MNQDGPTTEWLWAGSPYLRHSEGGVIMSAGNTPNEKTPDEVKYPNRWAHFGKLYEGSGVKNETDQPEEVLAPERRKRIEDDEEV